MRKLSDPEYRIGCPDCGTVWSTYEIPSECDTCGALVTFRVVRRPPRPIKPVHDDPDKS